MAEQAALPGGGFTSCVEIGVRDRHAVLQHARHVGEMLVQRAAERDVHHLHAAADRERRQAEPVGGEQQVDLELVAVGLDAVRVLPVASPP